MINLAVSLAPISLVLVCVQTSSFWISILAYFMLSEPIFAVEIVAMIVCFGCVVLIES